MYNVLQYLKLNNICLLKNLIINSIDAISEKDGVINIDLHEDIKNIKITIEDNGIGMPVDEPSLIFNEEFSTKASGTGLGLFIVKRIAELHHGTIEIKSEKNVGTVITIEFPAEFVQDIGHDKT